MKKLVIIGGGFAGSYIARNLQYDMDVTLIDTKDYFEYTPGILKTIINPEHLHKIQKRHSDYLKKARIVIGEAGEVSENFVKVKNEKIGFDYLVISSGSRYCFPIKEQNIVYATRAEHLIEASENLRKAKRAMIIGGGLVGVELSAEISCIYPEKEIIIIEAGKKLVRKNNSKTSEYIKNFLQKKKVKIIFNKKVSGNQLKSFIIQGKNKIQKDMVFICNGVIPNFEFLEKNFKDKLSYLNFLNKNDYLQLEGYRNIFVAGDIVNDGEKTAQNSRKQAKIVVHNIRALENNKELKKYNYEPLPMVISLGKYHGVFEYRDFVLTGFISGILKHLIEKMVMIEYF